MPVAAASICTVTVTCAEELALIGAFRVAVTTLPLFVQIPGAAIVHETKDELEGMLSVTTTFVASAAGLVAVLVTVTVYVTACPRSTSVSPSVFEMVKFGSGGTTWPKIGPPP